MNRKAETLIIAFAMHGCARIAHPLIAVLIIIVVYGLTVAGLGLLEALGLVTVTVIVASELAARMTRAQVEP